MRFGCLIIIYGLVMISRNIILLILVSILLAKQNNTRTEHKIC